MARTGPYAAAQLWKLDNIHGRYIDLCGLIAPVPGRPDGSGARGVVAGVPLPQPLHTPTDLRRVARGAVQRLR